MTPAVKLVPPSSSDPMRIPAPTSALAQWIDNGQPGSFFLTQDDKLYVMTRFDHRLIQDKSVASVIIERERFIRNKVKQSQKTIRYLFSTLLLTYIGLSVIIALLVARS